jgi:hypothetical protein
MMGIIVGEHVCFVYNGKVREGVVEVIRNEVVTVALDYDDDGRSHKSFKRSQMQPATSYLRPTV